MEGPNPRSALHIIDRIGLYNTIFTDPIMQIPVPSTSNWKAVYDCLEELSRNDTPGCVYRTLVRSEDAKYLAWILAALAPWATIDQPRQLGLKAPHLATVVAREGIKADNKVCNLVAGAFKDYREITDMKTAVVVKDRWTEQRDVVGMSIRRWDSQGGHWRLQALFALLVEVLCRTACDGGTRLPHIRPRISS